MLFGVWGVSNFGKGYVVEVMVYLMGVRLFVDLSCSVFFWTGLTPSRELFFEQGKCFWFVFFVEVVRGL